MKIGTKVIVSAKAEPEYIGSRRTWVRTYLTKPKEGWYVGFTWKMEGDYRDGKGDYIFDKYEHPYLTNINTKKLYRIKLSENSNDTFCYPQDVKEV